MSPPNALPALYRVIPRASYSVWMQDGLFSADALEAILSTPISTVDNPTTMVRGGDKFHLLDLLNVAIALSERGTKMGRASRLVDVACITPREHRTRWDLRLSDLWVENMRKVNVAFAFACEIVDNIRKTNCSSRAKVDWHVQLVLPGSPDQDIHVDDKDSRRGRRCYYTFIVPLTDNPRAGGTSFPKLGTVFTSYGGAVCFDGTVEHAGLGNRSQQPRHFLYAAIYTGKDENC